MSIKPYVVVGTVALFGALIFQALGAWQIIDWLTPATGRPVIASVLFLIAIICLGKAAWSAWQLQLNAETALKMAQQSNQQLQRRIEAAEAKLVKAIDQEAISWSPALQNVLEESEARFRTTYNNYENELRQAYNSYRRRAERGYLGGDEIDKPPPPITPQDI